MEPVRWGVLGVADHFRLRVYVPTRDLDNVEIHGIASRSADKAKKAAKEFDIPVSYGSYEDLLKDDDIEAVFIPLPNHMHVEWIKKTADAGKHILCEKPLAMSAKEASEGIEYAEKKGVMLMEAFMHRFHPQWQEARNLVRNKSIGKLKTIQSVFSYFKTDPNNIRNIPEMGGGGLMDIGCYPISLSRFLFENDRLFSYILKKSFTRYSVD